MNTPTIQDVNDLGCCCPFPEAPANRWQNQPRNDDSDLGGFKRWVRPIGALDEDNLPEIYTEIAELPGFIEDGNAAFYQGWIENPTAPGEWAESLQDATLRMSDGVNDGLTITTGNTSDAYPVTVATPFGETGVRESFFVAFSLSSRNFFTTADADTSSISAPATYTVTNDVYRYDSELVRWQTTAEKPSLQGVGGESGLTIYFCDVLVGDFLDLSLSIPVTRAEFITLSISDLALVLFSGTIQTSSPETVTSVLWSKVGDFPWPPENDIEAASAIAFASSTPGGYANLIGAHYKVGIPEDWQTMNAAWVAWVDIHAAWEAADPETRGDEPIRGNKRSVFELEWDEAFFPTAWEDYVGSKDAWDVETAAWEIADPETRGDAPIEPIKPTEPEDRPQLLTSRSWTYGGPEAEPFSDWIILTQAPDNGKSRPVNMMIVAYHSTAVGVKPTAHGEQIDFSDP